MKTTVFVLFMIFCISCDEVLVPTELPQTKSAQTKSAQAEPLTTYQILNNLEFYPQVELIDGSLWEVIIYYYIGNEIVKIENISPVLTGEISAKIEVPSSYEKLKYSFQLAPKKSQYYFGSANCRRYSENFTLLEKGKNTIIEIHDLSSINLSL